MDMRPLLSLVRSLYVKAAAFRSRSIEKLVLHFSTLCQDTPFWMQPYMG